MKNERILSYKLAQQLGEEDVREISGGVFTCGVTYNPKSGWDSNDDTHGHH